MQLHKIDEIEWCAESQARNFVRTYKDNEVEAEEEKKLYVARAKESLPFGMHIRKAAYSAAFGKDGSHPVL